MQKIMVSSWWFFWARGWERENF